MALQLRCVPSFDSIQNISPHLLLTICEQVRITPAVTDFLCDAIALLSRPMPATPSAQHAHSQPPSRQLPSPPRLATTQSASWASPGSSPSPSMQAPPANDPPAASLRTSSPIADLVSPVTNGGGLETGQWVLSGRLPRLDLRILSTRPSTGRTNQEAADFKEASVLFALSELGVLYMPSSGKSVVMETLPASSRSTEASAGPTSDHACNPVLNRGLANRSKSSRDVYKSPYPSVVTGAPLSRPIGRGSQNLTNECESRSVDRIAGLSHRIIVFFQILELQLTNPAPTLATAVTQAQSENYVKVEGLHASLLMRSSAASPSFAQPTVTNILQHGRVLHSHPEGIGIGAAATAIVVVARAEARANLRSQQVCKGKMCRTPACFAKRAVYRPCVVSTTLRPLLISFCRYISAPFIYFCNDVLLLYPEYSDMMSVVGTVVAARNGILECLGPGFPRCDRQITRCRPCMARIWSSWQYGAAGSVARGRKSTY